MTIPTMDYEHHVARLKGGRGTDQTGDEFIQKFRFRNGDLSIGCVSDSTWNETGEAFELYLAELAGRDNALRVVSKRWADPAMSADNIVQAGIFTPPGIIFNDTFTRTAADLFGTQPDVGPVWGRDGTNAAGDWSINGTQAVRTADTTAGAMVATGSVGNQKVNVDAVFNTTASAASKTFTIGIKSLRFDNELRLRIFVSTNGATTTTLIRNQENVATTLGTFPGGTVASNVASAAVVATIQANNNVFSATVNGATLSVDVDMTWIAEGRNTNISATASMVAINSLSIESLDITNLRQLTAWNAAQSGANLTYFTEARLRIMFPQSVDVILINMGHNYGGTTPTTFLQTLSAFITMLKSIRPEAEIVISSQNPQKLPATQVVPHLARQQALRGYCAMNGYGYIKAAESFRAQADYGDSLINADGVHPIAGGNALWRDAISDYFDSL